MELGSGIGRSTIIGAAAALALSMPAAAAQDAPPRPAAGGEIVYSSDSDDTEIVRAAIDVDLRNRNDRDRLGLRVERAWYNPSGTGTIKRARIFLRAADTLAAWQWEGQVGTDGHSIIGAASIHDNARARKELFVERDVVETRQGLTRGIYSTFVGGTIDLPIDDRNVFTAMAGVQEFTGDNVRLHLRGSYIHVLQPDIGLSAQLRGRYYRSTRPGEFDYYSPRFYAQVLPVLQMRRFVGAGWEVVGVGGIGVQRDSSTGWGRLDFAQFRVRSPFDARHWSVLGEITYTNAPSDNASGGGGYSFIQTRVGATRRF